MLGVFLGSRYGVSKLLNIGGLRFVPRNPLNRCCAYTVIGIHTGGRLSSANDSTNSEKVTNTRLGMTQVKSAWYRQHDPLQSPACQRSPVKSTPHNLFKALVERQPALGRVLLRGALTSPVIPGSPTT